MSLVGLLNIWFPVPVVDDLNPAGEPRPVFGPACFDLLEVVPNKGDKIDGLVKIGHTKRVVLDELREYSNICKIKTNVHGQISPASYMNFPCYNA